MPMGMADVAYVLWTKFLKHNPANPDWADRDRFILSAGHGSMLLYSLLHLTGYPDMTMEQVKNFRQLGSITPGHPESHITPGVEMTTGPLGQGFAAGVGMAMAEAFLAAKFNINGKNIVDHFTYAVVSDGDLMEGISHEAASLAGHQKLGKLIYFYDSNRISIDGSTDLSYSDDAAKRFEAYNWQVQQIDGHDHKAIETAIIKAKHETGKPSLIICKTHIGYGSPNKADSASAHGSPLGEDEIKLTKEAYGWDTEKSFHIPEEALQHFRKAVINGKQLNDNWNDRVKEYAMEFPDEAKEFERWLLHKIPEDLEKALPQFDADPKGMATRKSSGAVLNKIADVVPNLIGGSADLTPSNNTWLDGKGVFNHEDRNGRNIHYGVREHAMAAAVNGMAIHKGVIPYAGTFFIFTDYMRPAIRLAALMRSPSIFVLTHDSIGLGEDGPTHQPVEHLMSLRAMPNINVIRPGDANEVAYAWKTAIERVDGPTLLVLTRQNMPVLHRNEKNPARLLEKGAYIYNDSAKNIPDAILIASGSELHLAVEAKSRLGEKGIDARVVSMPCWELFKKQDAEYQEMVLPKEVTNRVSIEAGATQGWEKWIGNEGIAIGIDTFGESGPYTDLFEHFGITANAAVEAVIRSSDK